MNKILIGKITHFFPKISVAVLEVTEGSVKVGDKISIEKGEKKVEQTVESMQVEHQNIEEAKAGDKVGLKTVEPVAEGSHVYKLEE
ncbi:MAG: translation elongation factor-like protein [Candidatus Aenigmarchaeota archaeon]|nr:translation elongation factor-like protein [Candidatus Aenigmarchaeota archaeon]